MNDIDYFQPNNPSELYIDLLKRSLTNYPNLENGMRISYLLLCMDTSVAYDLDHVKDIGKYEAELLASLKSDQESRENYRERILGFPKTMIGRKRLDNVEYCVRTVLEENIPGDFLEAGVWRGGAAIFMRALLKVFGHTDRTVWVADSFQGVPPPSMPQDQGINLFQDTWLSVSQDIVAENFSRYGLLDDQVRFLPGWFKDTLPDAPVEQLAVLRLDGDLYESTMDVLVNMYDKVAPGGFIIIDDYYAYDVCGQAVRDFLQERDLKVEMHNIDWTATFWRKV